MTVMTDQDEDNDDDSWLEKTVKINIGKGSEKKLEVMKKDEDVMAIWKMTSIRRRGKLPFWNYNGKMKRKLLKK